MLIVKKFGGSSVANKDRIFNVAKRCIEDYRAGHDVVVVLSAMGDTTDELIALANTINPNAKKRELDMLLTTGEQVSVSLMAMAMQALDVPAVSLNAFQVMMHSTSRYAADTYHLCINSSVLGIEATAELIKDFAIKKLTAESK